MAFAINQKTRSELLFEQYLRSNAIDDWQFEPDFPGRRKHPDYRIRYAGIDLLAEIKERHCTERRPAGAIAIDPYSGLRDEIGEATKKFKEFKDFPCCLVVCNIDDWETRFEPMDIYASMFGDSGFTIDFDTERAVLNLETIQNAFLGNGRMVRSYSNGRPTAFQNTTISAIAVLEEYTSSGPECFRAILAELTSREKTTGKKASFIEKTRIWRQVLKQSDYPPVHVPRLRIFENPVARMTLGANIFIGSFDERWEFNGEIKRTFVGTELHEIEQLWEALNPGSTDPLEI